MQDPKRCCTRSIIILLLYEKAVLVATIQVDTFTSPERCRHEFLNLAQDESPQAELTMTRHSRGSGCNIKSWLEEQLQLVRACKPTCRLGASAFCMLGSSCTRQGRSVVRKKKTSTVPFAKELTFGRTVVIVCAVGLMSWSLPFYFPGYPLRRRFATLCKHIRAGNIDGVQELLRKDSRLVHARNKKGVTLLMLAAIHPDAALAVQMIDELVSEGASLGRRDRRNRHVLLHACLHGAGRAVMERLLEHGGYSIFKWNDFGIDGQTALLLACTRADTPMTTFLLDRIEIETYAKHNHPFKVLKAAIDTGNERHALETAQHEKIRASIQDPERTRYKGSGATELAWTISTCTEAAVGKSMMQLVQVMDQFNWRKVSRAVWYMVNQLVREGVDVYATVPAELLTIGKQFTGDWRWSLVRELCVARFGRGDEGQTHPLARLPDDVFLRVAAFVVPPPFHHPSEYVSQWCRCSGRALFGECYWHDSYKATRSDYHWPYNWTGSS